MTEKQTRHADAPFTEDSLRRLLTNELYIGIIRYQQHRYRGEQPRIVPARLWRRVQRLLASCTCPSPGPQRNKAGALLQGLLHCSVCGRPMAHTSTCRGERRYRYYTCRSRNCTRPLLPAERFESAVLGQLSKLAQQRGVKLEPLLRLFDSQVPALACADVHTAVRAFVERVTYEGASGEVSIQLRRQKEKRNA
jgi:hypothetical protein